MSIARRWQERRERIAREEAAEAEPPRRAAIGSELEADSDEPASSVPDDERSVRLAAERAEAEAVDLDTLGPGADMTTFLRDGVPAALRRRAFRALWRSSPVFGDFERLNDYDEDFHNPKFVGAFKSAWEAGRGYAFAKDGAQEPDVNAGVETEVEPVDQSEGPDDGAERELEAVAEPVEIASCEPEPPNAVAGTDTPERVPNVPSLRQRLGV